MSGAPRLGTNQKVNNLALLAREARHDVLVMSDGDARVGPEYLREVVAPLANPQTGAVTSLYRDMAQRNLRAQLEAIGAASDFCAGVLLASSMEDVSFALGASIATTKPWLSIQPNGRPVKNADSPDIGTMIGEFRGVMEDQNRCSGGAESVACCLEVPARISASVTRWLERKR